MSEENLPKELPANFKPFWKQDLSIDDYHKDRQFISSTAVRAFLKSPAHFYWYFIKGEDVEMTSDMEFGQIAHICILEPRRFREKYIVMPEFVGKTKDGRDSSRSKEAVQAREQWLRDQDPTAVIVTQEEFHKLSHMVESILSHKTARHLLQEGKPEVSGYYRDPVTGLGLRIRPDFLKYSLMALSDLKTTRESEYRFFRKQVELLNYDVQMAMYTEGFHQIEGDRLVTSNFIAIQKEAPYNTCVYVADDGLMDIGARLYRRALDGIRECLEKNHWPGYQPEGLAENMGPSTWGMERA